MNKNIILKKINTLIDSISIADISIESLDTLFDIISSYDPNLGNYLKTILLPFKIGMNIKNSYDIKEKFILIAENVLRIIKKLEDNELNLKAYAMSPELHKQIFYMDDKERIKDHLLLTEYLYTSNNENFDDIFEAMRITGSLSNKEFQILKLVPIPKTDIVNFKQILIKNGFDLTQHYEKLISCIYSLTNKNLVKYEYSLKLKMDNGTKVSIGIVDFNDKDTICLTDYGKLYLDTLKEIKENGGTAHNETVRKANI